MKNFKFTINGNKYEADIQSFEKNIARIEVNGTSYTVELDREVKAAKTPKLVRPLVRESSKPIEKKEGGSLAIKAPLPGNILNIMVKAGDEIKKDQKLLIMEAMKMENEIKAEKDGIVKAILVQNGQSVLQGEVLIEIG